MAADTWHIPDPSRLHPDRPVIDDDSADAVENAIHQLSTNRSPLNETHAGLRLHALASLITQAQALLPAAVADARNHDFHWTEIAADLGITTSTARRRYPTNRTSTPTHEPEQPQQTRVIDTSHTNSHIAQQDQ